MRKWSRVSLVLAILQVVSSSKFYLQLHILNNEFTDPVETINIQLIL